MRNLFRFCLHILIGTGVAIGARAESDASVSPEVRTKARLASDELSAEDEKWIQTAPMKVKVGQLFIFGFMGHDLRRGLKTTLKSQKPGALIIFERNIVSAKQLVDLNFSAQKQALKSSGLPLLIAVDQEGGSVIRIRTSPPLPSALALGQSRNPHLAHSAGLHTGRLLRALGFNMNLAPVLDVADPATDRFVGTRTFGKDPEVVGQMGTQFALGLSESGVLPTAKHFPGHGGVADSHRQTPVKRTQADVLEKVDLAPFFTGLREVSGAAVMLAHIAYPHLDPSGLPATFSKPIVTGLLRNKWKFNGLIVTDDIEMAGASAIKDPAERAVRAIEAGVDLVMIAWNKRLQARAVEAVARAVRKGRISESRIDESLRRILHAKRNVASSAGHTRPSLAAVDSTFKSSELQKVTFDTLYSQFKTSYGKITSKDLIEDSSRPVFVFAGTHRFFTSFKQGTKGRKTRFYRLSTVKTFDINRILRANPDAIGVLHVSGYESAKHANRIEADNASRVILVNSETVSLLKNPRQFHHIIDIHFKHPDLGRITAQYFFNDREAKKRVSKTDSEPGANTGRDPSATTDALESQNQSAAQGDVQVESHNEAQSEIRGETQSESEDAE